MADLTLLRAARWSPRAFDLSRHATGDEAASLLEAARWAPSAGNRQPWRFALGHRDDETETDPGQPPPAPTSAWAGTPPPWCWARASPPAPRQAAPP